jgi:hypothetical protein
MGGSPPSRRLGVSHRIDRIPATDDNPPPSEAAEA